VTFFSGARSLTFPCSFCRLNQASIFSSSLVASSSVSAFRPSSPTQMQLRGKAIVTHSRRGPGESSSVSRVQPQPFKWNCWEDFLLFVLLSFFALWLSYQGPCFLFSPLSISPSLEGVALTLRNSQAGNGQPSHRDPEDNLVFSAPSLSILDGSSLARPFFFCN